MDIPLSILLLLCLIFLIIGAVAMLLLQYYVYIKFSVLPEESEEQRNINVKYSLPMAIKKTAKGIKSHPTMLGAMEGGAAGAGTADEGSLIAINFVMQFLFHELKNSNRVRKWFYRKLSLELDELIAKTTTGKLFDKLTIKELELGDQFPEIKTLRVHNVDLDEVEERIESLDLLLQIHYTGNFRTSIDADMVLGKKGSLTLKVKQLSGLARLQFTRKPYTHWSLSFLGDPEIDLAIESKYQGRQMQSNITSLISNQIRKAVRRKHTLPNYKLRYKPFFHKTPEEDTGDGEIQPNGILEVKIAELSRLNCAENVTEMYCTITMASLPFVEVHQKDDRNVVVSMDVEIHKAKNQQIGIIFKQTSEQCVEIEAVLPNTPACKSNLKAGDILMAIEGRRVSSIQQVAKVVKGLQNSIFRLRIERVISGIIRNDAILEDLDLYEDLGDIRTGYSSTVKQQINDSELTLKQLITRHNSAEKGTSSESSLSNTPTSSPKKSKLIAKALKKTISRENSETASKDDDKKAKQKLSVKLNEEKVGKQLVRLSSAGEGVNDVEHYYQHSTIDCLVTPVIHMEDLSHFKLDAHCRFLNICAYGKCPGESVLLGFVNVPINQVLAECCETSLSQCWKTFELNPPVPQDLKSHLLSSQSGFNSNMCFGDILFAFTWEGNPNLTLIETPSKQVLKNKAKSGSTPNAEKLDDNVIAENKLVVAEGSNAQPRAHNFIRTHFQRATQCDFCGKKIWLKDAVQCRECSMCCHKKCVTKCQNSTVCGPVDCGSGLQQTTPTFSAIPPTPEFMVTAAPAFEATEYDDLTADTPSGEEEKLATTPALETHRSSLTGLLAQGIKRVNSANNLAIPGIVSTLTGSSGGGGSASGGAAGTGSVVNAKSLPPSPQHSPSRKSSLIAPMRSPFDVVTQRLETLPTNLTCLTAEQVDSITEPIVTVTKDEDIMTLAKTASRQLYVDLSATQRVTKINNLLSKLRLALDSETANHAVLTMTPKLDNNDGSPQKKSGVISKATTIGKSEERIQALSVIMLYLCTGLQHAQGVACQ